MPKIRGPLRFVAGLSFLSLSSLLTFSGQVSNTNSAYWRGVEVNKFLAWAFNRYESAYPHQAAFIYPVTVTVDASS